MPRYQLSPVRIFTINYYQKNGITYCLTKFVLQSVLKVLGHTWPCNMPARNHLTKWNSKCFRSGLTDARIHGDRKWACSRVPVDTDSWLYAHHVCFEIAIVVNVMNACLGVIIPYFINLSFSVSFSRRVRDSSCVCNRDELAVNTSICRYSQSRFFIV